jgi:hypothetical protein
MENEELDFDDLELGASASVEDIVDDPKPDPAKDSKTEPEPEPESKKQRGRPKKQESNVQSDPEPNPEPEPEPKGEGEEEEGEEETSLIAELAKEFGIEMENELPDDEEGLKQFVSIAADEIADQKLNGWLQTLPSVASEFFDYLQMLGDEATEEKIKDFFSAAKPEINFKEVNFDNEDSQKAILRTLFKKLDYSDEEIKETIDEFEIAGTLKKNAERAASKLEAQQAKEKDALIQREKEAKRERDVRIQQFWNGVKQTIETGKVGNFQIPVTEKKAIFDYDASGTFANDLNEILKDPEKRVELAIAVKNKFNLSKYIARAVQTTKAQSLKDRLKSSSGKMKNSPTASGVLNSDIDWEDV